MEPKFFCYDKSNASNSLDLNASSASCYILSFQDSSGLDETRNSKRLKQLDNFNQYFGNEYHHDCSRDVVYKGSINGSTEEKKCSTRPLFRDHIWAYAQKYMAAAAVEEADGAYDKEEHVIKEEGKEDGMRLVQLLVACAEAVAYRDKRHASTLITDLQADALVFGTSFQRVASCFVQGLSDRLELVQPCGAVGDIGAIPKTIAFSLEKEKALSLVYEICPQIQFGHYVANASILQAFEGESSIHVVDLGMTLGLRHGYQWRSLIFNFAIRAGRRCRLRITGVGNCADRLLVIGDELGEYAQNLGVKFEFAVVESNLENLRREDLKILHDEVLVINSILELHCAVKESRGALNSVLQMLNDLTPRAFILVEQESSHNGPFFLGRFMEALYYYSAIFDSLDAMLPKYDTRRSKMEQFYFGEEIKNIVSCEGPARVERHERLDQWRRRMGRAGFEPAPVKMLTQARQWLESVQACEGYTISEEKGCLVLGWKSKPIVAASCWKCS
ncbi:unnamed protein product [Coffea canephora]|uniref:Uncharacterized protein n=2 Tax=Coffea TaxID=13442 RepID=A0A068UYH7_COFCA|nr:unnamed protein product [Coffea canephora]